MYFFRFAAAALLLSASPLFSQSFSVTYSVDSNWGSGLQARMSVTNRSTSTLRNWSISFTYPLNITSIWDSTIASHSGNNYVVRGPSWSPDLAPGATANLGWVASISGTAVNPSACLVNGQPVASTTCTTGTGGGGGTPTDTTPPSVPTGFSATAVTSTSVNLQWNASTDNTGGSGVSGYEVYNGSSVAGRSASPFLTVSNLSPSTSYSFQVRAKDNTGNFSAFSKTLKVTTQAPVTCTTIPAPPTGLISQSTSSRSVSLTWNAVAPGTGCTITYSVLVNHAQVASGLTSPGYLASNLQPTTPYTFTVKASSQTGASLESAPLSLTTPADPPPTISNWPARVFAPYIDVTLWPTPSLTTIKTQSGVKYYTLAFITARSTCEASWGGVIALSDNLMLNDVTTLRSQGGDVIVSFGGANGIELGQSCTSVAALQAQYQTVIDKYSATRIDFDIEGGSIAEPVSIDRRNKAIAGLQATARATGKTLIVQYTLPVMPFGLTADGVTLLRNAVQNGVDLGTVNIMAMDYGGPQVADPNQMGQNALAAMNSTFTQMQSIYGSTKTPAQLRAMQGVTPMIGMNDVSPEVFKLNTDAPLLVSAAQNNGIGLLAFWSIARDVQCPGGNYVSPTCSGVSQAPFAFSTVFRNF